MSGKERALLLHFRSLSKCLQYLFPDDLQQYLESWTFPIALHLFETSLLKTWSFRRGGSPSYKNLSFGTYCVYFCVCSLTFSFFLSS